MGSRDGLSSARLPGVKEPELALRELLPQLGDGTLGERICFALHSSRFYTRA